MLQACHEHELFQSRSSLGIVEGRQIIETKQTIFVRRSKKEFCIKSINKKTKIPNIESPKSKQNLLKLKKRRYNTHQVVVVHATRRRKMLFDMLITLIDALLFKHSPYY
ncbi:hypothetical protein Droror1_Dr00004984 [Drosera rotundifolia]